MGASIYCEKSRNDIEEDVNIMNSITNNSLYEKRVGFEISFQYERASKLINNKTLNENEMSLEDQSRMINIRQMKITCNKFYQFFGVVILIQPILYQDVININSYLPVVTQAELCVICMERKNDIVLECLHLFCTECIQAWLLKKDNRCPICRIEVKKSSIDKISSNWTIIDKEEIDEKSYLDTLDSIFLQSLKKLIEP